MSTPINVSVIVNAPLATVWDAFTQPQHITGWNFASDDWHCPAATNDLREGGSFSSRMAAKDGSAAFDFGGEYTRVQPHEFYEYRIGDGRTVRVEFESLGDGQTKLTETFETEDVNSAERQREGWQAILENFKKYTEGL